MPQLDGLRAIAVLLVIIQHYHLTSGTGRWGVRLFFVLSGFLITGILLSSRNSIQRKNLQLGAALRQFYIRRTLRIFPLYYLVLGVAILFGADYARDFAPWLLSYTINLKMAAQGWYIDHFAHFWSLAVEEQFYLFWPWIVLMLRPRWLLPTTILMTLIGPAFRLFHVLGWAYWGSEASGLTVYISTLSTLDSLGMGALLAIATSEPETLPNVRRILGRIAPLAAAILLIDGVVPIAGLPIPWAAGVDMVALDTVASLLFAWMILQGSTGFPGIPGRFLSARPVVFIGTISYGLYVYHQLVPGITRSMVAWGIPLPTEGAGQVVLWTVLTFTLSVVSAVCFERPINNLKGRFESKPAPKPTTLALPPQLFPPAPVAETTAQSSSAS
jgi:peptidoglycan/LPS O-acetylase OafA/YrhL